MIEGTRLFEPASQRLDLCGTELIFRSYHAAVPGD